MQYMEYISHVEVRYVSNLCSKIDTYDHMQHYICIYGMCAYNATMHKYHIHIGWYDICKEVHTIALVVHAIVRLCDYDIDEDGCETMKYAKGFLYMRHCYHGGIPIVGNSIYGGWQPCSH